MGVFVTAPRPDVDPAEAARLSERSNVVLLDVREPAEWEAGHAAGAVHQSLGTLDPAVLDPALEYVAVCRTGNRSGKAAAVMAAGGLQVANMAGGMTAWAEAGLPMVRDDGGTGIVG
jgi:rhodanese-related sulfurtransferase